MPSLRQSRRQKQLAPESRGRKDLEPCRAKRPESSQGALHEEFESSIVKGRSGTRTDAAFHANKEILRQAFLSSQQQPNTSPVSPQDGLVQEETPSSRLREASQEIDRRTTMKARPLKRPKQCRQQSKQDKDRQSTAQQLMRQQRELLEKYEQRLNQLQPRESSEDETLSFTIAGQGAERPGIGYQSPIVVSDNEPSTSPKEIPHFPEFIPGQPRAAGDPHGQEALTSRRARLGGSFQTQRQNIQFVREALNESPITQTLTPSPSK
ncbi:hypothetical protein SARC_11581 [Sphaeroforma arctica JP610]|uniref:Uncharacterized protein n=1 Tax=Sphaeroforma arctica JP610 TaxID=667725 RepID=A0A0L0FHF6_9EUKA|nr:hypothetical protein SARC_11581 [Sphaeroforma arctica JP610]KNC75906.1 hypothetical protein SARC_11581 [Sphaeroforma arctica JP610]|eukprot:XP_014149808.1 hypothetical protein SARC_11581 [Sphaeroforma arctica JP610]